MAEQYTKIGVADIGTQLFVWNDGYKDVTSEVTSSNFASKKSSLYTESDGVYTKLANDATYSSTATYYEKVDAFEYALPITAGAEFGGDTESFEASETDLDYVPKIGGRTTLNDISYTINYTSDKYKRIGDISDNTDEHIYMEVLSDGGAMIFAGTSGMPSITAGDVRQINWTIVPSIVVFCDNIADMDDKSKARVQAIKSAMVSESGGTASIVIDTTSIPTIRQDYYTSKNIG